MQWIIQGEVFKERFDELINLIRDRQDGIYVSESRNDLTPFHSDGPLAALVTVQSARILYHKGLYSPGVFWHPERFNPVEYSAHLGEFMLNDDLVYLPWAEFVRRGPQVWDTEEVFIRPAVGAKVFTGQCISMGEFQRDVMLLDRSSSVSANTLIGVCAPKRIDDQLEYRLWLSLRENRIFAHSAYSWEEIDLPKEIPSGIRVLAEKLMARCKSTGFSPDGVFVADFCLSHGVPKLVEINAASCSGVYEANLADLLDGLAVEATAIYEECS